MQSYSLKAPGLWSGIEDWPHRSCIDAVVAEMQAENYSAKSIYRAVQVARRIVAWRLEVVGDAALGYDEVDRFIDHRRAAGQLLNGERKALARLRQTMVVAGLTNPPPSATGPAFDLLARFQTNLARRGCRPASINSWRWSRRTRRP